MKSVSEFKMPAPKQLEVYLKSKVLSGLSTVYPYIPDQVLSKFVKIVAGENQFPAGQKFLEKVLFTFKRALTNSNPQNRKKIVESFFSNVCVKGQAQRSLVTSKVGFDIPVLLVISPTMRCPLRCYGCYAAQYEKEPELDFNVFDRLLTEAKSLGIYFFVISGGEPFVYPGIYDIFKKHNDAWFQVYTSGVTLNKENVTRLASLGNVMPCISVEGFEKEVNARRGEGHFKKVLSAFENLRDAGLFFGFSATATRNNNELIMSDEFIKFYIDQGTYLGWYFQYMPVGRDPDLNLIPTAEQRVYRFNRMLELRKKYNIALADFWNDGPLTGGCLAGSRRYLHINHKGNVEPCVFCQISVDSIYEKSLFEILQSSRLFKAIRKRQPYGENFLRPCIIIDHPEVLKEVVEEINPEQTCSEGALKLVTSLYPKLVENAQSYGKLADKIWEQHYKEIYKPVIARARKLQDEYKKRVDK
jgi:MoaA/NifB/PqqE/SkfB family radical SAM enzyme